MRSLIKTVYSNEFIRGGFLLTTASFLANILNYLFNSIAGRSLGPSGYGELATFFSYSTVVSVPLTVISTIIIQRISAAGDDRFAQAREYESFLIQKSKKMWPWILVLLLFEPFVPHITNLSPLTGYSLIPFLLLSLPTTFFIATLQGLRLFAIFSLYSFIATLIKFIGALLVFFGLDGLGTIMTALYISTFFMIFAPHQALRRSLPKKNNVEDKINKRLRSIMTDRQFIITTLSILAITLFNNADIIFVKKFFSSTDAGLYASWSLFSKIILYMIAPLISVSFVFFASEKNLHKENQTLKASFIALVIAGIGSFVIYTYFGEFVVTLFFGEKYVAVIPYLSKASLFGSFYTGIFFLNQYLLAKKRNSVLLLPIGVLGYMALIVVLARTISQVITITTITSGLLLVGFIMVFFVETVKINNTKS